MLILGRLALLQHDLLHGLGNPEDVFELPEIDLAVVVAVDDVEVCDHIAQLLPRDVGEQLPQEHCHLGRVQLPVAVGVELLEQLAGAVVGLEEGGEAPDDVLDNRRDAGSADIVPDAAALLPHVLELFECDVAVTVRIEHGFDQLLVPGGEVGKDSLAEGSHLPLV